MKLFKTIFTILAAVALAIAGFTMTTQAAPIGVSGPSGTPPPAPPWIMPDGSVKPGATVGVLDSHGKPVLDKCGRPIKVPVGGPPPNVPANANVPPGSPSDHKVGAGDSSPRQVTRTGSVHMENGPNGPVQVNENGLATPLPGPEASC